MRVYVLFAIGAFAVLALLSPAVARADCGAHDISTSFAPAALALEKMQPTPQNLLGGSILNPEIGAPYFSALDKLTLTPIAPCADDPRGVQAASQSLGTLWVTALKARGIQAIVHLVGAGDDPLHIDKACIPGFHAAIRWHLSAAWYTATSNLYETGSPGMLRALAHLPEADHVLTFYRQLASSENLPLTPIGYSGPPNNAKLQTDVQAAHDHLPTGINCPNLI